MPLITNALIVTAALATITPGVHCLADGHGGGMAHDAGGPAVCTPLVIDDPASPLAGYTLFSPEEKRNNPNAGDPSYVFLTGGSEAVVIDGPAVPSAPGLLTLANPSIALVNASDFAADGYTVVANGQLRYQVAIDDFEYEVALSRVELCESGNVITSKFTFRGNPIGGMSFGGVAHDITITGAAAGIPTAPSTPVTVEVR
jgi:hypothetical protein